MTFALARIPRLDLETFARAANLHPQFIRRLVALGLLAPAADAAGELWFSPTDIAAAGRLQRLRAGLSAQLRRPRARGRPAGPHRRAGSRPPPAPTRHWRPTVDMNRLTQNSQEALQDAQTKALRFGHTEVDGEHLLLALLDQPDGLVPRLLTQAGADADRLRAEIEADLSRRPKVTGPGAAPGQVFVTRRLSRLLDTAEREAHRLKDEYVSVEHLLVALLEEGSETAAGRRLREQGLDPGPVPSGPHRACGATSGSLRRSRRSPTKRSRSTAAIWWPTPGPAGSTPSSAATARSAASYRFSPARRRTTRC